MKKLDRQEMENIDITPGKLKRFLRKAKWFFSVYLPGRHDSTVLTRNGLLTFDSKDKTTGRILHIYRNHEFDDMMMISNYLREKGMLPADNSGTVLDVGGYIGMSSTAFLLENVFQKSIAFEPSPGNYKLLQKNIKNNDLTGSLIAYNVALSDKNGSIEFELSEKNYGDHRVRSSSDAGEGYFGEENRKVISVSAKRFDDFLSEHSEISQADIKLIWMDTQGHEAKFMAGAKQFLLNNPNVPIMMEFWPYAMLRSGVTKEEFVELVHSIFKKFYFYSDGKYNEYDIDAISGFFDQHLDPNGGAALLFANS